jgi:hypothetical protein
MIAYRGLGRKKTCEAQCDPQLAVTNVVTAYASQRLAPGRPDGAMTGCPCLPRLLHMGSAPAPLHVPCLHRGPYALRVPCPHCGAPSTPIRMQADPATAVGGCCRWVPLQHVQHQDVFLQYLDKILVTYVRNN